MRNKAVSSPRSLRREHAATDAAEDALYGPGRRGDEVPSELVDPRSRAARIERGDRRVRRRTSAAGGAGSRGASSKRRRQREAENEQPSGRLCSPIISARACPGGQMPTGRPPAEIRVEILDGESGPFIKPASRPTIDAWAAAPVSGRAYPWAGRVSTPGSNGPRPPWTGPSPNEPPQIGRPRRRQQARWPPRPTGRVQRPGVNPNAISPIRSHG